MACFDNHHGTVYFRVLGHWAKYSLSYYIWLAEFHQIKILIFQYVE